MSVKTTIEVIATSQEDLKDFIRLLSCIQYCGRKGTSGNLNLMVDGDGSGRYNFLIDGKEIPTVAELPTETIWLGE